LIISKAFWLPVFVLCTLLPAPPLARAVEGLSNLERICKDPSTQVAWTLKGAEAKKLLTKEEARMAYVDGGGWTALHYLASADRTECLICLDEHDDKGHGNITCSLRRSSRSRSASPGEDRY
jgi:hypothetical protein